MNNHTFFLCHGKNHKPLLRFSLGRRRQWLQGRSRRIWVPRWFRKDPRVKYLVPHIRHAGKAPMDAVCELLRVCLLLWCQQLTLPDRIQRCVGVLPIIWHPRDVNHCDWNLRHGASHLYYQIKHPHVMVQVQGLAVVLIRKGLLYASDPLRISPVVWAVFTRRKQVLARSTRKEMSEISWQFATQKQQKFEASFMLTPSNHNCFYLVPFLYFFPTGTRVHQNKIKQHAKKSIWFSTKESYSHTRCKNKVKVHHTTCNKITNGACFLLCCPGHAHVEAGGVRVLWNISIADTSNDFCKILATRHSRLTWCLYFTLLQRRSLL